MSISIADGSIIRLREFAGETPHERLLKKHVPAWVISGVVNLTILLVFVVTGYAFKSAAAKPNDQQLTAVIDDKDKSETRPDLTETDVGLDPLVAAAVENAKAAQPAWAATNPQRRARVMMKFVELVQRDYDKLAELLADNGADGLLVLEPSRVRSAIEEDLEARRRIVEEYAEAVDCFLIGGFEWRDLRPRRHDLSLGASHVKVACESALVARAGKLERVPLCGEVASGNIQLRLGTTQLDVVAGHFREQGQQNVAALIVHGQKLRRLMIPVAAS